jgi:NAD(P)-dependent dehydrogenase (short-subunit alcohol dehydrogenase family)
MTDHLEAPEEQIVLGRKGTPEEVADSVLHLLSSPYMTGSVLSLDGGLKL